MRSAAYALIGGAFFIVVVQLHGANIFEESFDYGDAETTISSVSAWSANSNYTLYDPDRGLEHPQLGAEKGGTIWRDYETGRTAAHDLPDFDLSTTAGFGEGSKLWLALLLEYTTGTDPHGISVLGGSVSVMGVQITSDGSVIVECTKDGAPNLSNDTGIDLAGGTYLMLVCYTKGSGSKPQDSRVDLWINPSGTHSERSLPAADWTLDSDAGLIKWGRDGDLLTSIALQIQRYGRIDEIRIGVDFEEVTGGVQPPPPKGMVLVIK